MKITVAGIGYVGLSLAVLLAQKHEVTAIDVLQERVDLVNKGSAGSRMNIQLLEDPDGENSLCLTYNDQMYEKSNALRLLELIRSSILELVESNL
jgi:UDP-glucose 6-dehydrogenase